MKHGPGFQTSHWSPVCIFLCWFFSASQSLLTLGTTNQLLHFGATNCYQHWCAPHRHHHHGIHQHHHHRHHHHQNHHKHVLYDFIEWIIRRSASISAMIHSYHVVLNKTTHQHMWSDCSCVIEYSHIIAGLAWARYPLCLLISCVVPHSLNKFIRFSKEINLCPSCFVHACLIHLWTAINNLNRLKQPF